MVEDGEPLATENCLLRAALSRVFDDFCRVFSHPFSVKGYLLAVSTITF